MKTVIRTFDPDYAYLAQNQQNDPYELVGLAVEHHGKELCVLVQDSPYLIASALEAIAVAIRRTWLL